MKAQVSPWKLHVKERANAPRTSTLSMGIEKAGAYESSLGSIFGRCVKAFWGSVGENERQLKQSFPRIKNYSLQWGAAESVQDKIQLTAKNSGTKKRGLSVALKKTASEPCGGDWLWWQQKTCLLLCLWQLFRYPLCQFRINDYFCSLQVGNLKKNWYNEK